MFGGRPSLAPMTHWEYHVNQIVTATMDSPQENLGELMSAMNALAADGWELVSSQKLEVERPWHRYFALIWRRPVQDQA
jgi:hypothetical protein